MLVWLLLNVVVETSCWQQRQRVELHGTHFPVWWLILVFISFSLLWMVLVPMICFRLVPFLKAIMGSVLKVSLQLWFACNMCQCFVIISFKFGNDRLYVTDKGMHCLSCCKFSGLAVVFLECWAYSLNSKCLAVGNTFL